MASQKHDEKNGHQGLFLDDINCGFLQHLFHGKPRIAITTRITFIASGILCFFVQINLPKSPGFKKKQNTDCIHQTLGEEGNTFKNRIPKVANIPTVFFGFLAGWNIQQKTPPEVEQQIYP